MGGKRGPKIKPDLINWIIEDLLDEQRKNKTEITKDLLRRRKWNSSAPTKDKLSSFRSHLSKVFSELEERGWIDIEYGKPEGRGNTMHYCSLSHDIGIFKEIAKKFLSTDDNSIYFFMNSKYKEKMTIPLLSELLDKLGLEQGIKIRSLDPIDYEIKDDFLKADDFLSELMDAIAISPTFLDLVVKEKIDKNSIVKVGKLIQPMIVIPAIRPLLSSIDPMAANYFLNEAEKILDSLKGGGVDTDVSDEIIKMGLKTIALNSIFSDLIKYPEFEESILDLLINKLSSESSGLNVIEELKNLNTKSE